jgi:hypothetical protein
MTHDIKITSDIQRKHHIFFILFDAQEEDVQILLKYLVLICFFYYVDVALKQMNLVFRNFWRASEISFFCNCRPPNQNYAHTCRTLYCQ